MEPVVDTLSSLITTIGTVITAFLGWFSDVATALLSNVLIQFILGIGIAFVIYKAVVGLVKTASGRRGKKRR